MERKSHKVIANPESSMEENMKKTVISMLILNELAQSPCSINEIYDNIESRSSGALKIGYPYQSVYRLINQGAIAEIESRVSKDGRRRKCYSITPAGRKMLAEQIKVYKFYTECTQQLLNTQQALTPAQH